MTCAQLNGKTIGETMRIWKFVSLEYCVCVTLWSESYIMEEFCINLSVEDIVNYRLSLVSKLI